MALQIEQTQFQLSQKQRLNLPHFCLEKGQYWAVMGSNGSGKSAFAQALAGELPLIAGEVKNSFQRIQLFSFEKQRKLLESTLKDLNNDDTDPQFFGKTAKEVILEGRKDDTQLLKWAEKLGITSLLDRYFIKLSTGESRKILLARALYDEPDLIILDEPFEGLDQHSVQAWQALLSDLLTESCIVLIVNRLSDIPPQATHLALLAQRELVLQGARAEVEQESIYQQLCYAEQALHIALPEAAQPVQKLPESQPRFELKQVNVRYGENQVLQNLSWTIEKGQNWWIKGPNGAGKSTLLSLLTGDHPQAFANHVMIFGRQRGSGETVWEIKQKIGYVSSQLHLDYRVNCSALDVIISGFFDSIGVYQKIPESLRLKAMEWLERLHLGALAKQPFRSLSWGQQRLLLITRAMVKHPPVLILDEPFQGLDGLNRTLLKQFIEQLVDNSETQLLFVSHQDQDAPDCITHLFEFVPEKGGFHYVQRAV